MIKLLIFALSLWFILFLIRILMVGGLDPDYHESSSEKPLEKLQQSITLKIKEILPYPQSGILAGMLIGDQRSTPFFLKKDLQDTSTIHMMVVSGQNLTILAAFLMGFVSLVGRKRMILLILAIVSFYSILTGLQVPVIRASIMAFFAYGAQLIGKEMMGWWALLITAGLMLLYNPNWLFSISFQLSFLATFGVVVVAPLIEKRMNYLPRVIRFDLSTTLAAQLLTLPIIAFNFGQISLVGVLANLLLLWTVPLIMISGAVAVTLGYLSNFLGQLVGLFPSVLLTYFIYIVQFFADLPLSSLEIGQTAFLFWIGYYLLIGGLIMVILRGNRVQVTGDSKKQPVD